LPKPSSKEQEVAKGLRASMVLRLDRAAGELNPFLIIVTIGLLILNLVLYLGLSVSRQPSLWAPPMRGIGTPAPVGNTASPSPTVLAPDHR
jgi:hypothetical protein